MYGMGGAPWGGGTPPTWSAERDAQLQSAYAEAQLGKATLHIDQRFPPLIAALLQYALTQGRVLQNINYIKGLCNEILAIDHVEIDGVPVHMRGL